MSVTLRIILRMDGCDHRLEGVVSGGAQVDISKVVLEAGSSEVAARLQAPVGVEQPDAVLTAPDASGHRRFNLQGFLDNAAEAARRKALDALRALSVAAQVDTQGGAVLAGASLPISNAASLVATLDVDLAALAGHDGAPTLVARLALSGSVQVSTGAVTAAATLRVVVVIDREVTVPRLDFALPEWGIDLGGFSWPDFDWQKLGVSGLSVRLPSLPSLPVQVAVVTPGTVQVQFNAATGNLSITVANAVLEVRDSGGTGLSTIDVQSAGIGTASGVDLRLKATPYNGGGTFLDRMEIPLGPLALAVEDARLLSLSLATTAGGSLGVTASVSIERLSVWAPLDPEARLSVSCTLDVRGDGVAVRQVTVVEPSRIIIPEDWIEIKPGRWISVRLPGFDVPGASLAAGRLLSVLGRIAAALAQPVAGVGRVVGRGLAGLAQLVGALLRRLLEALADAGAAVGRAIAVQVIFEPGTTRVRQVFVTGRDDVGSPPLELDAGLLRLSVPGGYVAGLLVDLAPPDGGSAAAYLALAASGTAVPQMRLEFDPWRKDGESPPENIAGPADGSAPPKPALTVEVALRQGTGLVLAGFDGRREVFFKGLSTQDSPVLPGPGVPGWRLGGITTPIDQIDIGTLGSGQPRQPTGNATVGVDLSVHKESLLPFLAGGDEAPGTDPGRGPFQALKQKVWLSDVENPRVDATAKLLAASASVNVAFGEVRATGRLDLALSLDSLAFRIGAGPVHMTGTETTKSLGTYLGLEATLLVDTRKQPTAPYKYFKLDLADGGSLGLADGCSLQLAFRQLSDGDGLRFRVTRFSVTRGGVDLDAAVMPEAVPLAGLGTPFRFEHGSLSVRSGRLQGFSLAGSGLLPPALVGEAKASILIQFGPGPDGGIEVLACQATLDKGNDPIVCNATNFTLTLREVGLSVVRDNGYHFYFTLTGSARFTPQSPALREGLLKFLPEVVIELNRTPLAGDARVLSRHIKFVVPLTSKVTATVFNVFEFELRSVGFEPQSAAFGGAPAMVLGGQVKLGLGDVIQSEIDVHAIYVAGPDPNATGVRALLPRVRFEGLKVALGLSADIRIEGRVAAVDGRLPSLARPDRLPEIEAYGFLGEGSLTIEGLPTLAASMGFLEVADPDTGDRKKAFFLYIEARRVSLQIPVLNFYLREIGFGFGYRYTLAAVKEAERATSIPDLIQRLSRAAAAKGDLSRFAAWQPDIEKGGGPRLTFAMRGMVSMLTASPDQPLNWKDKEERELENPFLFDIAATLLSDFTFLMTLRGWIAVNYAEFDKQRDTIGQNPPFAGFVYLSPAQKTFLGRFESRPNGYIPDKPFLPPALKRAIQRSRYSATLYVKPGLFHFELGWPDQLGWGDTFGPLSVDCTGGFIFRIHQASLLLGINFAAKGSLTLSAEVGGGSFGVSVSATANVALQARMIGYVDAADFRQSLYYCMAAVNIAIEFSVRAWLRFKVGFVKVSLSVGFSFGLQVDVALELALSAEPAIGGRARCYVAVSVFGRRVGIGVDVALNAGMVERARRRVQDFMGLGLGLPVPEVPETLPAGPAQVPAPGGAAPTRLDEARDREARIAELAHPAPASEPAPAARGRPLAHARFWAVLVDQVEGGGLLVCFVPRGSEAQPADAGPLSDFLAAPPVQGRDPADKAHWDYLLTVPATLAQHVTPLLPPGPPLPEPSTTPGEIRLKTAWQQAVDIGLGAPVQVRELLANGFHLTGEMEFFTNEDGGFEDWKVTDLAEPAPFALGPVRELPGTDPQSEARLLQRFQREFEAYRLSRARQDQDLDVLDARSFLLTLLADGVVDAVPHARGQGTGLEGKALFALALGTTVHVDATGAADFLAALDDGQVHFAKHLPGLPVPDGATTRVMPFNPPSTRFDLHPPDFERVAAEVTEAGVAFRWDLSHAWSLGPPAPAGADDRLDPDNQVLHYEVRRVIGTSADRPLPITVKPTTTLGAEPRADGSGWDVFPVRSAVKYVDDFADLDAADREALLARAGQARQVAYTIVPVCHAGRRGLPLSLTVTLGPRPQVVRSPAGATLTLVFEHFGTVAATTRMDAQLAKSLAGKDWADLSGQDLQGYLADVARKEAPEAFVHVRDGDRSRTGYRLVVELDGPATGSYGRGGEPDAPGLARPGRRLWREEFDLPALEYVPEELRTEEDAAGPGGRIEAAGSWVRKARGNKVDGALRLPGQAGSGMEAARRLVELLFPMATPQGSGLPRGPVAVRFYLRAVGAAVGGGERPSSAPVPVEVVTRLRHRAGNGWTTVRGPVFEWPLVLPLPPLPADPLRVSAGPAVMSAPAWGTTVDGLVSQDGKALSPIAERPARVAATLSWPLAAPARELDRALVAGFAVHSIDTDEVTAADTIASSQDIDPSLWRRRGPAARVLLASPQAARQLPADTTELQAWQARYPSDERRAALPPGSPWYSPAESALAWPEHEPRRQLFPTPRETMVSDLMAGGRPQSLTFRLVEAGATGTQDFLASLLRAAPVAAPDTFAWRRDGDGRLICTRDDGKPLGSADVRAGLARLELWPDPDAAPWRALVEAPARWRSITLDIEAVPGIGGVATAVPGVPLGLDTLLHPMLVEILAVAANLTGEAPVEVALQPPPKPAAPTVEGLLAAVGPGPDPHGWGALQAFGLAAVISLYDPASDRFLLPSELLRRVRLACGEVAPRYGGLGRHLMAELMLRPGSLVETADRHDGAPARQALERQGGLDAQSLGFLQLSLRPLPVAACGYAALVAEVTLPAGIPASQVTSVTLSLPHTAQRPIDVLPLGAGVATRVPAGTTGEVPPGSLVVPAASLSRRGADAGPDGSTVVRYAVAALRLNARTWDAQADDGAKKALDALVNQATVTVGLAPAPAGTPTAPVQATLAVSGILADGGVAFPPRPGSASPDVGPFGHLSAEDWSGLLAPHAAGSESPAARGFSSFRRLVARAAGLTGAGEVPSDGLVASYVPWAHRFLEKTWPGTALPDTAALPAGAAEGKWLAFAVAEPTARNPWTLAPDRAGRLSLTFLHEDRWACIRSYAVVPIGRYDDLLASTGHAYDPHDRIIPDQKPREPRPWPRADAAFPRLEPVKAPAFAYSGLARVRTMGRRGRCGTWCWPSPRSRRWRRPGASCASACLTRARRWGSADGSGGGTGRRAWTPWPATTISRPWSGWTRRAPPATNRSRHCSGRRPPWNMVGMTRPWPRSPPPFRGSGRGPPSTRSRASPSTTTTTPWFPAWAGKGRWRSTPCASRTSTPPYQRWEHPGRSSPTVAAPSRSGSPGPRQPSRRPCRRTWRTSGPGRSWGPARAPCRTRPRCTRSWRRMARATGRSWRRCRPCSTGPGRPPSSAAGAGPASSCRSPACPRQGTPAAKPGRRARQPWRWISLCRARPPPSPSALAIGSIPTRPRPSRSRPRSGSPWWRRWWSRPRGRWRTTSGPTCRQTCAGWSANWNVRGCWSRARPIPRPWPWRGTSLRQRIMARPTGSGTRRWGRPIISGSSSCAPPAR